MCPGNPSLPLAPLLGTTALFVLCRRGKFKILVIMEWSVHSQILNSLQAGAAGIRVLLQPSGPWVGLGVPVDTVPIQSCGWKHPCTGLWRGPRSLSPAGSAALSSLPWHAPCAHGAAQEQCRGLLACTVACWAAGWRTAPCLQQATCLLAAWSPTPHRAGTATERGSLSCEVAILCHGR